MLSLHVPSSPHQEESQAAWMELALHGLRPQRHGHRLAPVTPSTSRQIGSHYKVQSTRTLLPTQSKIRTLPTQSRIRTISPTQSRIWTSLPAQSRKRTILLTQIR